MNINFQTLVSLIKSLQLTLVRNLDHGYRLIRGVPMLKHSEITPQLYLGGQYSNRGFKILRNRGITGIISMRIRPKKNLADLGEVSFLHLPTKDLHAPTITQLQQGVEFIDRHIKQGGKVYIHCAVGEGRGPTMIAAYLLSLGLTLDDALAQIKKVRTFIRPTQEQLQRLQEFKLLHGSYDRFIVSR